MCDCVSVCAQGLHCTHYTRCVAFGLEHNARRTHTHTQCAHQFEKFIAALNGWHGWLDWLAAALAYVLLCKSSNPYTSCSRRLLVQIAIAKPMSKSLRIANDENSWCPIDFMPLSLPLAFPPIFLRHFHFNKMSLAIRWIIVSALCYLCPVQFSCAFALRTMVTNAMNSLFPI